MLQKKGFLGGGQSFLLSQRLFPVESTLNLWKCLCGKYVNDYITI